MTDTDNLPAGVTRRLVSPQKCDCDKGVGTRMQVTQIGGWPMVREAWIIERTSQVTSDKATAESVAKSINSEVFHVLIVEME